jgi:hypothetical protein
MGKLYMFRALLAHLQEALHKQQLAASRVGVELLFIDSLQHGCSQILCILKKLTYAVKAFCTNKNDTTKE